MDGTIEDGIYRGLSRLSISYGYGNNGYVDVRAATSLQQTQQQQWQHFYQRNGTRFFHDRHWMMKEWPILACPGNLGDAIDVVVDWCCSSWLVLDQVGLCIELGCGVGNSLYPLMESSSISHYYSCDFSEAAITALRQSPQFDPNRVTAFQADICSVEQVIRYAPQDACNVALFIFVLSALHPQHMPAAVATAHTCLKRGGIVLFRDYAWGDAAQLRFDKTPSSRLLETGLYLRGDGTKAYFFTEAVLRKLFEDGGFECVELAERQAEPSHVGGNPRRFLQAMFRKL